MAKSPEPQEQDVMVTSGSPGDRTVHYYYKDPKTGETRYEASSEREAIKLSRWMTPLMGGAIGGATGLGLGFASSLLMKNSFPKRGKTALISAAIVGAFGVVYGLFKSKSIAREVLDEQPRMENLKAVGFTPPVIAENQHPAAGKSDTHFRDRFAVESSATQQKTR